MESGIESSIPAFNMWKTFNDTIIPALFNNKFCSGENLQRLTNIVKSNQFSNIFVYSHDSSLSYQEYQDMASKYKAFTVWLLGRFYHLLTRSSLQDLIISTQIRILQVLSVTERPVFLELIQEYATTFSQLVTHFKNNEPKFYITNFIPPAIPELQDTLDLSQDPIEITSTEMLENMILKTIPIIDLIITTYHRNTFTDCLENSLYILSKGNVDLKLAVMQIYISFIERNSLEIGEYSFDVLNKFELFLKSLYNLTFDVFTEKIQVEGSALVSILTIVQVIFERTDNQKYMLSSLGRLAELIYNTLKDDKSILKEAPEELRNSLWLSCTKLLTTCENKSELMDITTKFLGLSKAAQEASVSLMEKEIFDEIKRYFNGRKQTEIKQTSYERKETRNERKETPNERKLTSDTVLLVHELSPTWKRKKLELEDLFQMSTCPENCQIQHIFVLMNSILDMITRIKMSLLNHISDLYKPDYPQKINFEFFKEDTLLLCLLELPRFYHRVPCIAAFPKDAFLQAVPKLPVCYKGKKNACLMQLFVWPLEDTPGTRSFHENPQLMDSYEKAVKHLKLVMRDCKDQCAGALWEFLNLLSSGIVDLDEGEEEDVLRTYFRVTSDYLKTAVTVPKHLSNIISYGSPKVHPTLPLQLMEALKNQAQKNTSNQEFINDLTKELPTMHCILKSSFSKATSWNETTGQLEIKILCFECGNHPATNPKGKTIVTFNNIDISEKFDENFEAVLYEIWKHLPGFENHENTDIIKLLPEITKHSSRYHRDRHHELYVQCMSHENENMRKTFAKVVFKLLRNTLEHTQLDEKLKDTILEKFFQDLITTMKNSLQFSKYDLQKTVLSTIEAVCPLKSGSGVKHILQLLLYMIMIPTSRHSYLGVNIFIKLAKHQNTQIPVLYRQHKQHICKFIASLCAVNQHLIKYNLNTSLAKISVVLGYFGPKEFLIQEHQFLLPFFVPLAVKMAEAPKLLTELADLVEMDLRQLLANGYGNIFLHIFLNEDEDVFKKCMKYLEVNTQMNGVALRKKNFKVLLNELLVNFHAKHDRVLLALKLLAQEDTEQPQVAINQIPDYLQPRFLGILQYFDTTLYSKGTQRKEVLLSLAEVFKLMGPKRIAGFKLKIIAMLQTALDLNSTEFSELNCDVWDVFARTCDLEALGPQLATVFTSIMPLLKHHPKKINGIFRYLLVENEDVLKDYIPDLFFVLNSAIDYEIIVIIQKYMEDFEQKTFQDQLKFFLKYLTHETMDIRIHALKFLKKLLEKNREQLDQMILGYNGIDETIVEIQDILTSGCREKEDALRLACGECIGELGAIEPSHFPRRYAQEVHTFTFYIKEDTFVINCLSELTRGLQAEKNTQNMDRYAFAIQETLKRFEISPDPQSRRHNVWNTFQDFQKEIMVPFLTSRYTMLHPSTNIDVSPIYGSTLGSTSQLWVFNWACSLISSIKPDTKLIIQVYLPLMRQDYRITLHFLPHILLHSILEGTLENQEKAYNEIVSVISSYNSKQELDPKILNTIPLYTSKVSFTPKQKTLEEIKQIQCTKVVFVLLDFLHRWTREFEWQNGAACRNNDHYKLIKGFLKKFCKLQLARINYQCGEYPRALMYLEDYVMRNPDEFKDHLYFLAEIYSHLDEPDGVAGVTALHHTEPSLEHQILAYEISGKLGDAAACYERMSRPLKIHHLQGLVQCYLDLDNVNTALSLALGDMGRQPEHTNTFLEIQAEPLWRLGKWDDLDDLLKKPELKTNTSWGVQVGQALLHLKDGHRDEFQNVLTFLRGEQVNAFGAASLEEGAYQHGYNYIAKLHALSELEQVEKIIYELLASPNDPNASETILKKLTSEWELRFKVVQESIRIIEPILCLRRVALHQAKELVREKAPHSLRLLDSLLGECWLLSAKTAQAAQAHQQTFTFILKAEEYAPPRLFLEKARLHWMREEHEQALTTLRRGLERMLPEGAGSTSPLDALSVEQRKICAEAKLLIASYNDSTSNVDTDVNIQHYKEAAEMFREWEKSLVCLAQYYDRIFQSFSNEDRDSKGSDMQIHMINYFGKSLQFGTTYVYQSMPRLLSIWFDYGTRLLDVSVSSVKHERKSTLLKMTRLIDTFLGRLPSFVFFTAFSQLVSRICHPQKEVHIELKAIIIKLILQYPQQSLWMIIPVIKSSYSVRSQRCAEILNDKSLKTPYMLKFIGDFTKLAEKLIELCNKEIGNNVQTTSVNMLLRTLPRMLTKPDFSEIMMPTQKFRKLILPNSNFKSSQHNPFPNHYVYIVGIEDEIQILPSMQRPRKIVLKGSDGGKYIQMLKPKDDLRKDFRLMEFNDIVNQLLSREAESRQRRLNIRLYSVTPLNEECGLIEWVPNLVGLRPVLMNLYKQRGLGMKGNELKANCCNQRDSFSKKKDVYLKKFIPSHPPILGEWFKKTFPDAQSWLAARTAYIRTTAVISMTGYILGLGDRHGENILLDSTCGDTVHVDFNCLFNKGETFEWPERVPFRLTHNMVAAMGPLGVEGVFRKSCACTLKVLRNNITTLMSIVTPFVYDPLVSWPRNISANVNAMNAERTNEQAVEHIQNIELRLKGKVRTRGSAFSIPLSVEGQTNNLILDAVSVDNLCQMYIGWGPYL